MEVIIDKEFLQGFFKHNSTEEKKSVYDSFLRFVKSLQRGFKLICDFEDNDELESFIINNPLLNEIEDRSPEYDLKPDLLQVIKQPSFYKNGSSLKIFFLESLSEISEQLEDNFGYSFISGANLEAKWKCFLTDKEINRYFITKNPGISDEEKFDSWSKLGDYRHPLNSIVIADKYILCDKYEQKINNNLKPLLRELIQGRKNLLPVDITIIAEQKQCKQQFEILKADLEDFFKNTVPNTLVNLTLIDYDDELKAFLENKHGTDFHDRRIITTYYWYEVGKGFNLFNHSNHLKPSNSKLYMGFNLYASNQDDVRLLLEEYAACASVAKKVHGSNKNRLLLPYQFIYNNNQPNTATA